MMRPVFATGFIVIMTLIFLLAGCQTMKRAMDGGRKVINGLAMPDMIKPTPRNTKPVHGSGSLKGKSKAYTRCLAIGTYNLLEALSNMQEAVGNKELAEQIQLQANDLKDKSDKGETTDEDYKKAFKTINESSVDREELSNVPANRGRIYLTKSSIHVFLGSKSDASALAMGRRFLKNLPSAAALLTGDILVMYNIVELSCNTLPTHIEKAYQWSLQLNRYMQDNDIKQPTEQEKREEAEKQGASEEEISDIFA